MPTFSLLGSCRALKRPGCARYCGWQRRANAIRKRHFAKCAVVRMADPCCARAAWVTRKTPFKSTAVKCRSVIAGTHDSVAQQLQAGRRAVRAAKQDSSPVLKRMRKRSRGAHASRAQAPLAPASVCCAPVLPAPPRRRARTHACAGARARALARAWRADPLGPRAAARASTLARRSSAHTRSRVAQAERLTRRTLARRPTAHPPALLVGVAPRVHGSTLPRVHARREALVEKRKFSGVSAWGAFVAGRCAQLRDRAAISSIRDPGPQLHHKSFALFRGQEQVGRAQVHRRPASRRPP